MIVLFTDFGLAGPYVGQMKAVLAREAPGVPVIDLFADAPAFDPRLSAYLLAAYAPWFPPGSVFLCVVDPGVGTERPAVAVEADGRWFVGPGNGLLEPVLRRAATAHAWHIAWSPPTLSASFHGRDLFAPVAAWVAQGRPPAGRLVPARVEDLRRPDWPDDLPQVVYIDHYGNAMTGLRAAAVRPGTPLKVGGHTIVHARTFGEVPPGCILWYENSTGLVEIAVNQGRASETLGLRPGSPVHVG